MIFNLIQKELQYNKSMKQKDREFSEMIVLVCFLFWFATVSICGIISMFIK